MTVDERLDVLGQICRALAHAHAHGVVHRCVEPTNILLTDLGIARLKQFGFAKLLNSGQGTVWSDDSLAEVDLRYLAPELINSDLGKPTSATDLYALGCIAYELFAGSPPFEHPSQAFQSPTPLPASTPANIAELISSLLVAHPLQRPSDASQIQKTIDGLRAKDPTHVSTGPKAWYDVGDVIDGRFEVRGKLGEGGLASVYRVYQSLQDREYALKIFNTEASYEKLQREFSLLSTISHPNVVHVVWADQTRAGQWYLVTELIEGETLTAYADGKKHLSPAEAVGLIRQLLQALEAIHPQAERIAELTQLAREGEITEEEYEEWQQLKSQGIVHRDIKPQNIIVTNSGNLVLIDFNIAARVGHQVETISGTPRYQSPDIVAGVEAWDVSPDLFAAGLVMYELLCWEHPYEDGIPRLDQIPCDPREYRPELSRELAEFLMKACAPYRGDRFASAHQMRMALEAIETLVSPMDTGHPLVLPERLADLIRNHPPNVNPMVAEFLTLSSQARRSNRGTRGMDDVAAATYVHTALDDGLSASVLAGRHQLVIVTGNAGDGKTAFIQQLERAALRSNAETISSTQNGKHLRYAGIEIITLYDGSQDEEDRTSDEILYEFFHPVSQGVTDGNVRLAAINEGRLRDFLMSHRDEFSTFARDIIAALDDPASTGEGDAVVVVNLNLRSVTAGGPNSIFSRQLMEIVSGPFWGPCEECDYRTRCPIKHNVDTFRDSTSGPAAAERLRVLADLVRLRRRRHLTMRDVRSLLSHVLFRDRICEEIPELLESSDPLDVVDIAYFQGVGGRGVPSGTTLERNAALLAEIDVALVSNPDDDREIARGRGPRKMTYPTRTAGDYQTELIQIARERAGTGYESDAKLARVIHEAARRQLYFERADDGWWEMLPYRRLQQFEQSLQAENTFERRVLRDEIIAAISRFEGMLDPEREASALWLSTNEEEISGYRCFRRFPIQDFSLEVATLHTRYVESEPDRLQLIHKSGATLTIDIDLVEVIERLREGFVPSADENRGFLVNLSLFKHRLLAEPSTELVLAAENRYLRIARADMAGGITLEPEVLG